MAVATRFRAPSDGRGLPHSSASKEGSSRRRWPSRASWIGLLAAVAAAGPVVGAAGATAADVPEDALAPGRELFARTWRPHDPRCHGGDGLGPLYNATSCLDCHRQGGPGGAGPHGRNVQIVSLAGGAVPRRDLRFLPPIGMATRQPDPDLIIISLFGGRPSAEQVEALATIHPGFRQGRSLVLHRYATDPAYALWRGQLKRRGLENGLALLRTERNTPPLFGLRLIDEVPNAVIEDNARRQSREVRGRVHTLDGGAIGRFGWKAQVGTLEEFVLTACAGELGLEAPGHHQAPWPLTADPPERTPDLTAEECDALVAYVRGLPRPVEVAPKGSAQAADVAAGRRLFAEIGCAECHTPSLGALEGVYSDLLLHDMGESLADHGNYYGNDNTDSAANTEWRTPPLWGFRDSGPYLHDGRARHLTEAVAFHAGQAAASARRFRHLSPQEHHRVWAFLESLAAPHREPSPAPDRGRAPARAEEGSYGR